jgi:hypothetical protein
MGYLAIAGEPQLPERYQNLIWESKRSYSVISVPQPMAASLEWRLQALAAWLPRWLKADSHKPMPPEELVLLDRLEIAGFGLLVVAMLLSVYVLYLGLHLHENLPPLFHWYVAVSMFVFSLSGSFLSCMFRLRQCLDCAAQLAIVDVLRGDRGMGQSGDWTPPPPA